MGKKKKRTIKRKNKGKNRAGAKKGSKKRRKEKVNKKKELCPLQIRIVELIEVITHNGKEYSVQGPAKKPRKPPKTIQGNITRKDKDNGAYKQYINLDNKVEKNKAHSGYGQCVRLKARIEWVDKKKKDSLAGKKVYWSSKADPGNKTGLTGSEKENFYSSEISMLGSPRYSETDKDGWTKVVEFKFSQYGGDKFRIFAQADEKNEGKGSGKKLKAGWYVVWRKFWYQVTEMKDGKGGKLDMPASVTTDFEKGYETVFIEFKEKSPRKEIAHIGNIPNADINSDAEAKKHFVKDDLCPFKAHVMTADYGGQTSETKTILDNAVTTASYVTPHYYYLWRPGAGTPWKVSARYQAHGKAWANIPDDKITVTPHADKRGLKYLTVDMSTLSPAPSATKPAKIELRLKTAGPSLTYGRAGFSQHVILCTGILRDSQKSADWNKIQRSDMVHEFGHTLGLVNIAPTKANAHNAWEDPSSKYHCVKPATDCAMYKCSSTTRLTTFHYDATNKNGCHDHLRRQDFSRSVMKNHWKA